MHRYMTDGILLRECTRDRMLSNYAAVILDESHERTVDTDILIGKRKKSDFLSQSRFEGLFLKK